MKGGELHEELVDVVRFGIGKFAYKYGYDIEDIGCVVEHSVAKCFARCLIGCNLRADSYVMIQDGYGVIPVEVGHMPAGKWDWLISDVDNTPVRVLRVDFDRHAYLLHPRHTQIEDDMMAFFDEEMRIVEAAGVEPASEANL